MARTVWAFEPIEELAGELGYVAVEDEALAGKLIGAGRAQDPYAVGPLELKQMISAPAGGYRTRELKSGAPDQGGYKAREMKAGEIGEKDGPPEKDQPPSPKGDKPKRGAGKGE